MALRNWKKVFLDALRESPNVARAARAAGVDRSHAYVTRTTDPSFAQQWDDVIAAALDDVEEAAINRARIESDVLAIFLLKSHRREVYGDRSKVELSGPDGGPVEFQAAVDKVYGDDDARDSEPEAEAELE